jgi:UDPglucose 6-dehydrogenase/GDP-mannose 6-dehydrogenase
MMRVSIVGTGYVGLVTGACLAEKGHEVVCVDLDEGKVERINRGQSPIREAGLDSLLKRHAGRGLKASADLAAAVRGSALTLIAVGTPFDGEAIDLSQVREAARGVGAALRDKAAWHAVVVKSTVVPGTTDDVVAPILEKESGKRAGQGFGVGMNPEFLTEGEAVGDFMDPDRLVLGARDMRTMQALEELYADFPGVPLVRTNPKTAEMIKYASNTLLATLISWSNEIANLGAALGGIDAMEVVEGVSSSRYLTVTPPASVSPGWSPAPEAYDAPLSRASAAVEAAPVAIASAAASAPITAPIAAFLVPGCGFGGSCLPKDTAALAAQGRAAGVPMRLLEAVRGINEAQPHRMTALLERRIPDLRDAPVTVLGLAFRPGTGDLRESPAFPIIRDLLARGCRVSAFDPAVAEETAEAEAAHAASQERSRGMPSPLGEFGSALRLCPTLEEAVDGARAILLVTRWPEFRRLPELLASRKDPPVVVDGRRLLDKSRIARYEGIGL